MSFGVASAAFVGLIAVALFCGGAAAQGDGDHDPAPPPLPDWPTDGMLPSEPVGYLPGAASVSPTGAAGYTIPLQAPPGRAGIEPSLALAYSSDGGDGLLGVGWGLSGLSEIRRCAKTYGTDGWTDGLNWDRKDDFCLDGKKLVGNGYNPGNGMWEWRTEEDTFARIQGFVGQGGPDAGPEWIRLWAKHGRVLDYTAILGVRQTVNPLKSNNVSEGGVTAVWVLSKVKDRSGNFMTIDYESAIDATSRALQYRPMTISYTGSDVDAGSPARRSVKFVYEDRVPFDQQFSFHAGVRFALMKRLQSIEMYAPPQPGHQPLLVWLSFAKR